MSRHAIVPGLALLMAATASAAVDPALLNLMMPDAKVLFGVRVPQTLGSPFGQYALNHLLGAQALTRFSAATGLDPQRDLQEVLVASATPGIPGDGSDALILVRGNVCTREIRRGRDPNRRSRLRLSRCAGDQAATTGSTSVRVSRLFHFGNCRRTYIERCYRPACEPEQLCGASRAKSAGCERDRRCLVRHGNAFGGPDPATSAAGFDPAALLRSVIETRAGLHFDSNGVTVVAEALTHSDAEAQGLAGILKLAAGMVRERQPPRYSTRKSLRADL